MAEEELDPEADPAEPEPEPYHLPTVTHDLDLVPVEFQGLYEADSDGMLRLRLDDGGRSTRAREAEGKKLRAAKARADKLQEQIDARQRPRPTAKPRPGPPAQDLVDLRASLARAEDRVAELEAENTTLGTDRNRSMVVEQLLPLVRGGQDSDGTPRPDLYPEAQSEFVTAALDALAPTSNGEAHFAVGEEILTAGQYVARDLKTRGYRYRGVPGSGGPSRGSGSISQVLAKSDLKSVSDKVAYIKEHGREIYGDLPVSRE